MSGQMKKPPEGGFVVSWCPLSDSNRPPTDYKSVALPDELKGQYWWALMDLNHRPNDYESFALTN